METGKFSALSALLLQMLINDRYQHAVTKAKTRTPNLETGGGILADEMGMGKSLSILALIANTLKDSNEWIYTQATDTSEYGHVSQRASRGTLVIVPSASKPTPYPTAAPAPPHKRLRIPQMYILI